VDDAHQGSGHNQTLPVVCADGTACSGSVAAVIGQKSADMVNLKQLVLQTAVVILDG